MPANEMKVSKNEFKCITCGAILNKGIILCPYCKTGYPSDKRKVLEGPQRQPHDIGKTNETIKDTGIPKPEKAKRDKEAETETKEQIDKKIVTQKDIKKTPVRVSEDIVPEKEKIIEKPKNKSVWAKVTGEEEKTGGKSAPSGGPEKKEKCDNKTIKVEETGPYQVQENKKIERNIKKIRKYNPRNLDLKLNTENIKGFIREHLEKLGKDGVVVGLSGGVDSAVVLKLCSEAIGSENVLAIILPERDSDSSNIKDAIRLARELKIRYINKKITLILSLAGIYRMYPPSFLFKKSFVGKYITKKQESISRDLGKDVYLANLTGSSNKELCMGMAYYRIKARIRSVMLFYYAELSNYLLAGCVNKSEWLTGFFVKYGDSIADIMPLISFYKTQVFAMADYLKLPDYITDKAPSPDLLPGIMDENMIGISYKKLDAILYGLEKKYSFNKITKISGAAPPEIKRVLEIMDKSGYLRKWPITF